MQQETKLPDPAQLRTFANDPLPFHTVLPKHLSMDEEGVLVATFDNVMYTYEPRYINVETAVSGEYVNASQCEWTDIDHRTAYERADLVTVEEDFVSTTGILPDHPIQYEGYWILETIKSQNTR